MPYESHSAGRSGETFIFPDGTRRTLAHMYFAQAKLTNNATLLKLYYSFCVVEIAGERLDIIFEDIISSRMGIMSQDADHADPAGNAAYLTEPIITSIIYLSQSENESNEGR